MTPPDVGSQAPALRIRIKKGRDGPHVLVCARPDGSQTMQHQRQNFFPVHDLTHYAVETTLGHRRGFYGLVAQGWNLDDFGTPWPRGPLPKDGDPSELIVGLFDQERATGVRLTADQVNATLATWRQQGRITRPAPPVTEAQLETIRRHMRALLARWSALEPGQAMELAI